jgi:uncharacterized membrane protein YgcG
MKYKFLATAAFMLFVSPLALANPPSGPQPGGPVVSQPIKPGECVVACVPNATSGGASGSYGIGGGSAGGGSVGGSCSMFCNPHPNPNKDKGDKQPTPPSHEGPG